MKKRILGLFSGVAIAALLAACSSGTTAAVTEKQAASPETAARTSVSIGGTACAVKEISLDEANKILGLSGTEITQNNPEIADRTAQNYVDNSKNVYQFDTQGRLTQYTAPEGATGQPIKLAQTNTDDSIEQSVQSTLKDLVPQVENFKVWHDPNGTNDANDVFLKREISANQMDSLEVQFDDNGVVKSIFAVYTSDNDQPIADSVKQQLQAQAEKALAARKAETKAEKAEIANVRFAQHGEQVTGYYTFLFTYEGGAQSGENATYTTQI